MKIIKKTFRTAHFRIKTLGLKLKRTQYSGQFVIFKVTDFVGAITVRNANPRVSCNGIVKPFDKILNLRKRNISIIMKSKMVIFGILTSPFTVRLSKIFSTSKMSSRGCTLLSRSHNIFFF